MFGKNKEARSDFELFVIFDSKTNMYHKPTYAVNQHDIVRMLMNDFSQEDVRKSALYQNAEDFQLFKIGSYDRGTGEVTPCTKSHVANLHELRAIVDQQRGVVGQQASPVGIGST